MSDRKAIVYKGYPPDHCCCDSTFRILPNGDWAVFFLTGGPKEPDPDNYVAVCRSRDEGYTWAKPEPVYKSDENGCLFSEIYVADGRLTLFANSHGGFFENWQNWVMNSDDSGATWSKPKRFEPMPRRTFLRNRFVMKNGTWLLPFQTYANVADPLASPIKDGTHKDAYNGTLLSADEGRTWKASNQIGPTAGWAENNVVELSDGRIVMLIRADGKGYLLRSESNDGGVTWAQPELTDIPNPGTKFRLHLLSDGRIILVHNPNSQTKHPNSRPQCQCNRNPLAMWISDDDMKSWGYQRILTDFPGMLAYPDGVVDEDERYVHFAFDYNRHDVIYWGAEIPPA